MSFHDIRFPPAISRGSSGGPERRTTVVSLASGHEERNSPWKHSRRSYDAGIGVRSEDDIAAVIDFFEARAGRLHAFRWKDWSDHKSCAPSATPSATDVALGQGDGARTRFALFKTYASGPVSYERPIRLPVAGTLQVALDGAPLAEGADFSFDSATGDVVLTTPPAADQTVTAGFEFDVPARFDTDRIEINLVAFRAGEIPSIPILEVCL
jgi:uncharacterized protein (TIGR02217 family)